MTNEVSDTAESALKKINASILISLKFINYYHSTLPVNVKQLLYALFVFLNT